jgi:hypothetical protein
MSKRQRRLLGIVLLVVGIGVASVQALWVSLSATATVASMAGGSVIVTGC